MVQDYTPRLKFILTSFICGPEDQDIIHENVLDFCFEFLIFE